MSFKRLSIFCHHDKYNIIDDYVVYWLKTMNKLSDIIFVSNNDLPETEIDKIKDFTIKNIIGNHGGVANVSLKKAFMYSYDNNLLERYDWLFIISDSIYGPFFDIEPFIKKEEQKQNVAYGFTLAAINTNLEHIQSTFISIPKNIFMDNKFYNFINEIDSISKDKESQVYKGEIGLSKLIRDMGYKLEGFFDDMDTTLEIYNRYEPVKSTFIEMIKNGYPFIRRTLFTKNYFYIENIGEYFELKNIIPKECFDSMQKNIDRVIDKEDLKINIYYPHIRKYLDYKKQIIEKRYLTKYGLRLELFEVETFIEKLNWLKLYYNTQLIITCMDKYSVREYIVDKIGDKYLTHLFGVYNNFADILFNLELNKLNDKVIFYSTINEKYILFDKEKQQDYNAIKYKLIDLINPQNNKYFENFEWCYKYIKPRILAYKYNEDIHDNKLKYKILCFNREPTLIKVIYFDNGVYYSNFYDLEWRLIDLKQSCPNIEKTIEKPKHFLEMLDISRKLSVDFLHFVAIELIETENQIYFSKFDFYSDDITLPLNSEEYDFELGKLIKLPQKSCEFFSLEQDTISMAFASSEQLIIEGIKNVELSEIEKRIQYLRLKNEELKLNCNWFSLFGISNNSEYLRLTLFGIKFTFRVNENIINKLAWWIPIRKLRDNFRNKFFDNFIGGGVNKGKIFIYVIEKIINVKRHCNNNCSVAFLFK